MHVALIGAEFEDNLAIRYLWGALERDGHQVTQIVFNSVSDTEGAARQVVASGAELAGFSMVFTYRAREFRDLAARARDLGYSGHIIAGGHFAAFNASLLLSKGSPFDSVALGEGEDILCELAQKRADPTGIPGVMWRVDGEIVHNPPARKPLDLDTLAEPPRKIPFDSYLGIPITNLLSSRGCSHACSFCSIAAWHKFCAGPRFRMRKPEHVADEMARLSQRGVKIFNFHDDNFVLVRKEQMFARTRALKDELARRGVGRIAFAVKSRPDAVDRDLFAFLKTMGLFRVFLGIEAGTTESLHQLGRGQTLADNERALSIVNRLGLHACFNLLLFNPESTLEDVAGNVAFLRKHARNPMNFCRTEIYAGTPLERQLRAEGRLEGDCWGYDYTIADRRAQTVFEIVAPAFENRNFGDNGLHHFAMQLDYELHLLGHFLGCPESQRRRCKDLVTAVNRNTCDHLDRVLAAVRNEPEIDVAAFGEELRQAVERDNELLLEEGEQLLGELRRTAQDKQSLRGRWVRTAAAAGLAASMAVGAAACKEKSHPTEIAPHPTGPSVEPDAGTHPMEMAAPAPPSSVTSEAPQELLGSEFLDEALRVVAKTVEPAQDVVLELWVDDQGAVSNVEVRTESIGPKTKRALTDHFAGKSFDDRRTYRKRFVLSFTRAELEAKQRPPTHLREMAPHPPPSAPKPPPTKPPKKPRPPHPTEMAPIMIIKKKM